MLRNKNSKLHFINLSDMELHEACKAGSVERVTECLGLGADVNSRFGLVCSMLMQIIDWNKAIKYNIKNELILKNAASKMFKDRGMGCV